MRLLALLLVIMAALYPFIQPEAPEPPIIIEAKPGKPVPNFAQYDDIIAKKKAFFAYLYPVVQQQNAQLLQLRHFVLAVQQKLKNGLDLTSAQQRKLQGLMQEYRVKSSQPIMTQINLLLGRVDMIPVELVLVQAANESAWGTSRFARQGYNFFGLWCFSKGCGFVPSRRNDDASHEVAKFNNLTDAVYSYIRNLNRNRAYADLRHIRKVLRQNQQPLSGEALSNGLMRYSERGQAYINELKEMIRTNRKYIPA